MTFLEYYIEYTGFSIQEITLFSIIGIIIWIYLIIYVWKVRKL